MSVKVRQRTYRETNTVTWQADIHVKLLDGRKIRERTKVPGATSRSAALKWAHERERWLILHGHAEEGGRDAEADAPTMPTLEEFSVRWMSEYVIANRLKPSTIYTKKNLLRAYLLPVLGARPLDAIAEADVQRLKATFTDHAPSNVNNMLTLLTTLLKSAIEWGVISTMPKIRKLKAASSRLEFYDEETFARLVAAAEAIDERCLVAILLGGDAGLRGGEIIALRLAHCDLRRGVLHVAENEWRGHVGAPKGNRTRQVVMTSRLRAALGRLTKGRSDPESRVLVDRRGAPISKAIVDRWLASVQRAAGLPEKGPHILRHTFCSRLAARGAPPKAIQELAGHASSRTTDRYMHLAPGALRSAIDLIDPGASRHGYVTSDGARENLQ